MVNDNSASNGRARDDVQGMEFLRVNLLTQEMALRTLAKSVDRRFQEFEGSFDEIVDRLDALAIGASRGRNEDMRMLRGDFAQGQPVNRPVLAHHRRQPVYNNDSKEKGGLLVWLSSAHKRWW